MMLWEFLLLIISLKKLRLSAGFSKRRVFSPPGLLLAANGHGVGRWDLAF